ncbi:hypothetical protein CYLTODRAFT_389834 [Cylindrobasidium torrendii FP15055 ss-10]|uniref:F-box domain-containing protein n=1 Tax=Cylindrobasidium torrendii FP15055 ss-10 TaxID=1314674 RepID=A0A0D7BND9_9AGAR|nr:hypothetical protein CYLTODRAFT_389834 [Cylindrobasidium torrendii FP15055 ss-10]
MAAPLSLLDLPSDVLLSIIDILDAFSLARLTCVCKPLKALVDDFGWSYYLKSNVRPSYGLGKHRELLSSRARAKYDALVDHSWQRAHSFVARPLLRQWRGKLQPVMTVSEHRIVIGAGRSLYFYTFTSTPAVKLEAQINLENPHQHGRDITSLAILDDDGTNVELIAGFENGDIQGLDYVHKTVCPFQPPIDSLHQGVAVKSIKNMDDMLLSLSAGGDVAITNLTTADSSCIQLERKSWTSYLSLRSSTPFAAFGTTAISHALDIHYMYEDGLSPVASLTLGSSIQNARQAAVYAIASAPPAAPWGASPEIVVSGWYDGRVRCYDLRARTRTLSNDGHSTMLTPVMTVADPLRCEPIYSISSGGGSASHIAAGTARHSVVSFWDIRNPSRGWSVHAPGNDFSPVYDVVLESSRCYGVTQSRAFVLDYGPNVTQDAYPHVPVNNARDGLTPAGHGFYVTQYKHWSQKISGDLANDLLY